MGHFALLSYIGPNSNQRIFVKLFQWFKILCPSFEKKCLILDSIENKINPNPNPNPDLDPDYI